MFASLITMASRTIQSLHRAELCGSAAKSAVVSVSAANGARAAVVLVVEDEALIRCAVADRLREAGYTVVETASGEEAIAMCKSDLSIDIVFTDIASGWDVAECV